ncbi:hypothetical protein [uncultured Flavobacterium sp.]|uniref:hypothetical protein n=1 Tax=uncultured Flavobacterium sp. TaxID=165435 RepID=UPI0030CA4652
MTSTTFKKTNYLTHKFSNGYVYAKMVLAAASVNKESNSVKDIRNDSLFWFSSVMK